MFDIYSEITNRMIAEMEQGIIPWQKPWMAAGAAISHTTGKPYSLLNQMLLGRAGEYLTYKQVQEEGGFVRKGEKAHMVVFWKWIDKEDEETGEVKQIPFLRYYNVFHVDQCEGIKARFAAQLPHSADADATAEAIIADYVKREGVHMEHVEGDRAFYRPAAELRLLAGLGFLHHNRHVQLAQFHHRGEFSGPKLSSLLHESLADSNGVLGEINVVVLHGGILTFFFSVVVGVLPSTLCLYYTRCGVQ